jgi:hypothetical protein
MKAKRMSKDVRFFHPIGTYFKATLQKENCQSYRTCFDLLKQGKTAVRCNKSRGFPFLGGSAEGLLKSIP